MEDAVVKKGFLYLYQQQTFWKKWRKFWGVLHGGSSCASACLELLESPLPPSAGKAKERESSSSSSSRCRIHLRDCVYVAEKGKDAGCPKETTPFLIQTTEKCYLLAAESTEAAGWILELCEHAFGRNSELQKDRLEDKAPASLAMDENPLYSPMSKGLSLLLKISGGSLPHDAQQALIIPSPQACLQERSSSLLWGNFLGARERERLPPNPGSKGEKTHFPVTVRATLASERIGLGGKFLLSAQAEALELWSMQGEDALYIWPYRFLRRFGHDKVVFSFEAGRRCSSGEGSFVFVTPHGKEIIQLIEEAIDVQWGPSPRAPSRATTLPAGATRRNSSEGGTWDFAVSAPDKGQPVSHATDTTTLLNLEPGWRGKPGKDCFISVTGSSPLPTSATRSLPQQLSDSFLRGDPKDGPSVSEGPGKMVAAGSESAEPLDATHKPLANSSASWPLHDKEQVPIPSLSDDGIQGLGLAPACLGPEHVYDDPEVLVNMIYDESQELKGEAWKLRATAEDPVGHEYPYNPCLDDYSVPKMAAVPPPFQLSGKGRKGLGQAACGDRFLGFKVAKDA
ncbi:docking protein 2 isoform X1 [Sceloporus undulatus]|uniref:docking protein 2 isoform X1 n=1 Tax=Sceloporus undulatus TaxID=8520 RepID=UPI001C4D9193|nr:docking protein 2 isoform X1 [Sceloporus undulatus]